MRHWRMWSRYAAVPLIVWLLAVATLAGALAWTQHRAELELEHRFRMRVSIAADFVANHVQDLLVRERVAAQRFLGTPDVDPAHFEQVSEVFGYPAAVLLRADGRLLSVKPANPALLGQDLTTRYAHLATAVWQNRPAVSRVVPSATAGVPVVAFAVPYETPSGRRVFSGAVEVQHSPLGSYLGHAVALERSRVYLIDPDGRVVASDARPSATVADEDRALAAAMRDGPDGGYRGGDSPRYFSAEPVAGTPWRLVATVPRSVLFEPIGEAALWRSAAVGVVGVAGLAGVAAAARSTRSRRALAESELELSARAAELEYTNGQLSVANQLSADVIAMLSHDLGQPLTALTGYTELLQDWADLAPSRRHHLVLRMQAGVARIRALVTDVLTLVQLDAHVIVARAQPVDVGTAVEEMLADLDQRVVWLAEVAPVTARVDPGHLRQILANLAGNAVKYGAAPFEIRVRPAATTVDVVVVDHGPGIPDDFVPRLFARFTRADAKPPGTGLGLYIVDQLARANQATVRYEPNLPTGCRFSVRLPRALDAEPDPPPPSDQSRVRSLRHTSTTTPISTPTVMTGPTGPR